MKRVWCLGLLLLGASACEEVTGPAGYVATFEDAAGLRAGSPVYVAGVKVGRVKTVSLDEGKAKVELLVEGQHGITMTDAACVSVGRYAFADETHVQLVPSKDGTPLEGGGALTCVKEEDELGKRMVRVTDAMAEVLEAALDGKGTIGRLLKDPELADRVVRFFESGAAKPSAAGEAEDAPDDEVDAKAGEDAEADDDAKAGEAAKPTTSTSPPAPPAKAPQPAKPNSGIVDPFD